MMGGNQVTHYRGSLIPRLGELGGTSTLASRVFQWGGAAHALRGDWPDITPILAASPLLCCCVLGSPPRNIQILVSGSASQGAQTKAPGLTNNKTAHYGVLNIYTEQVNTFLSAAGHTYTNKQTTIAMYITSFGENPRGPHLWLFLNMRPPPNGASALSPLPSPADRRLR